MSSDPFKGLDELVEHCNGVSKGFERHTTEEHIYERLGGYYYVIADFHSFSNFLIQIGETVEKDDDSEAASQETAKDTKGLWELIKYSSNYIKGRIEVIEKRLTNFAKDARKKFSDSFDQFIKDVENKLNIRMRFQELLEKFRELVVRAVQHLFDIISCISKLIKSRNFKISKIDLKIPTIKFGNAIPGIPIPIPTFEMPEVTFTIEENAISE